MSSSDDSDENNQRRVKERINLNEDAMTEDQFRKRYRLTKDAFEFVHTEIGHRLQPVRMNHYALSSRERLLIALRLAYVHIL